MLGNNGTGGEHCRSMDGYRSGSERVRTSPSASSLLGLVGKGWAGSVPPAGQLSRAAQHSSSLQVHLHPWMPGPPDSAPDFPSQGVPIIMLLPVRQGCRGPEGQIWAGPALFPLGLRTLVCRGGT